MIRALGTFLCATFLLAACSSGSKTTEPAKEATDNPAVEPGQKVVTEDDGPAPFEVEIQDWEGPTGEEGQVIVTVKAKSGFKINDKYPHKVTLEDPPEGLTLPLTTIAKKDAQLNGDKSITYTIPATANKAGQYKLQGLVRLSVCNKEQCRMAKEKLAANVTAQ